jgi:hypothetical protein
MLLQLSALATKLNLNPLGVRESGASTAYGCRMGVLWSDG